MRIIEDNILRVLLLALLTSSGVATELQESQQSRSFIFHYETTLSDIPDDTKQLELFLPVPLDDKYQSVRILNINSEFPIESFIDKVYGNRVLRISLDKRPSKPLTISVDYQIERIEDHNSRQALEPDPNSLKRFLEPDSLIPLDGLIADEARRVVPDKLSPVETASRLYNHLFSTMKYDKTGTGWGRGDAIYACDVRKGNCTDIHSAFIGMMRSLGIPARFVMGFPLPADETTATITGYHCWAQFYSEESGWISVDISEAIKHPDKKDYFFGNLDYNRVAFTIGRDIPVETSNGIYNLNYMIYPLLLIDGKRFDGFTKNFSISQIDSPPANGRTVFKPSRSLPSTGH